MKNHRMKLILPGGARQAERDRFLDEFAGKKKTSQLPGHVFGVRPRSAMVSESQWVPACLVVVMLRKLRVLFLSAILGQGPGFEDSRRSEHSFSAAPSIVIYKSRMDDDLH